VAKRSHHKKMPSTVPRKRNKFLGAQAEELEKPLVLQVPLVGSGLTSQAHSELQTEIHDNLRYQRDRNVYSLDPEATQVGRSSEDYTQYREQQYDVQASLTEARARGGSRQESELAGYSTGTTSLQCFSFGQDIEAVHGEIPASGDGHVPAPFAWTDPQLPVEEPVSTVRQRFRFSPVLVTCGPSSLRCLTIDLLQDDPDGVVHEVMSSWNREAGKSGQEDAEREDDTPQVDRRHFGSSGVGSEASLRLDMTTDFFANVSVYQRHTDDALR
jgi:hypothetical protein